jgi:hypothetical protein
MLFSSILCGLPRLLVYQVAIFFGIKEIDFLDVVSPALSLFSWVIGVLVVAAMDCLLLLHVPRLGYFSTGLGVTWSCSNVRISVSFNGIWPAWDKFVLSKISFIMVTWIRPVGWLFLGYFGAASWLPSCILPFYDESMSYLLQYRFDLDDTCIDYERMHTWFPSTAINQEPSRQMVL